MDYDRLGLEADAVEVIARAALASGIGARGRVALAHCHLFDAAPLTRFAVAWMRQHFGGSAQSAPTG